MSTFNPSNAQLVEDNELEDFLSRVDARAKSFRTQIIADAFQELAHVAKEERGLLLKAAAEDFALQVGKIVDEVIQKAGLQTAAQGDTCLSTTEAKIEQLAAMISKLEKAIRQNETKEVPATDNREVLDLVKTQMAAMHERMTQTQAQHDDTMCQAIKPVLAAIEANRLVVPPKRPGWSFRVQRDDYARISTVIATPLE